MTATHADCPQCDPLHPELDESGRAYTCYFCCDTGRVDAAVAAACHRAQDDELERFRPAILGVFPKRAPATYSSDGERCEADAYDGLEPVICSSCDGQGRTQPVGPQDETQRCSACRGDGVTHEPIQYQPGHRLFTGLGEIERAIQAARYVAIQAARRQATEDLDEIPF
jgi:hypothetical protein